MRTIWFQTGCHESIGSWRADKLSISVLRPASGGLAKELGVCGGEDARRDNNGQVLVAGAGSPVGAGDRSVLKRHAIAHRPRRE
jgi:hypothetical protein